MCRSLDPSFTQSSEQVFCGRRSRTSPQMRISSAELIQRTFELLSRRSKRAFLAPLLAEIPTTPEANSGVSEVSILPIAILAAA